MNAAWNELPNVCGRHPKLHGALALFLVLVVAYAFSIDIRASRGASITGDEPFYLITTRSLLDDGNLDLRAQYEARSYEEFFDHSDGLWVQSVPLENGKLLSPHNVGLSLLLMPGLHIGGLVGVQVQLLMLAALTWALAYVLLLRITQIRPLTCWAVTAGVALSAPAFIYSTEIYPELPAALVLIGCLIWITREQPIGIWSALGITVLISMLPWLGVKYVPIAVILGIYTLWQSRPQTRFVLSAASCLSATAYVLFHLATYESLTPYHVNLVYAGGSTPQIVDQHIAILDRAYRLWGLLIDRRFGIGRWAPLLLMIVPGYWLLVSGNHRLRLVASLLVIQVLMATFVAITMMGWWFPGRTLMVVFPLLPIPIALLANKVGWFGCGLITGLGMYSLIVTAVLAEAGHSQEIVIAVNPSEMQAGVFQIPAGLFPLYTSWTIETWTLTVAWLGCAFMTTIGWLRFRYKQQQLQATS